jgi:hypothetical protein
VRRIRHNLLRIIILEYTNFIKVKGEVIAVHALRVWKRMEAQVSSHS